MSNLKTVRKKLGLTQAGLAEKLGLTQAAIGHYETGRRRPSLDEGRRIVAVLQGLGASCTLDDVFPDTSRSVA